MNIIVSITPDSDGVRCGECDFNKPSAIGQMICWCFRGDRAIFPRTDKGRNKACLAAERKLRDLVEAGNEADKFAAWAKAKTGWDRAVKAMEEK